MQSPSKAKTPSLSTHLRAVALLLLAVAWVMAPALAASAQAPATPSVPSAMPGAPAGPIAIVPIGGSAGQAPTVTGALEVTGSKAIIAASGSVTSGSKTTDVVLPHRGVLRVCPSTTVKLAADASVPAGDTPGLLMAMDHGAVEASFATGRSSDILLTPDFRILIGGPGAADLKVRLGPHGDTCVDNAGVDAPYVVVSSVFDGGLYRVQPGQRVMFQHGSLREVVDEEKEPCGCPPPPAQTDGNEFPLAQSEGLAPAPKPAPAAKQSSGIPPQATTAMVYNSAEHAPEIAKIPLQTAPPTTSATTTQAAQLPPVKKKKQPGFFHRLGHFFRRIFGAES